MGALVCSIPVGLKCEVGGGGRQTPADIFFAVEGKPQSGKNLRRKIQQFFQVRPVEAWAGILFSTGGDVFVPSNVGDGVNAAQVSTQLSQTMVLVIFKSVTLKAFKFDADRVVIAVGSPTVRRLASMPCPIVAAYELQQSAIAAYVKV